MPAPPSRLSIKTAILWLVLLLTTGALSLSILVSNYHQRQTVKSQITQQAQSITNFVAQRAAKVLATPTQNYQEQLVQKQLIDAQLEELRYFDGVLNAHFYRLNEAQEPQLELLYIKRNSTVAESRMSNKEAYFTPQIDTSLGVVEVVAPVMRQGSPLGYIYLQLSVQRYSVFTTATYLIQAIIIATLAFIAVICSFYLTKKMIKPVETTTQALQNVARTRDYALRAPRCNISEYDHMIHAVNVLLSRVQNYLQQKQATEEQLQTLNHRLEEEIKQRTAALQTANSELINTLEKLHQFQRQMVENEKMASLGDMVAGVAHEVNTPIGLGVTASTMVLDRLKDIEQQFANKTLKASTMARFIEESTQNLDIIYRNLNKAAELIASFKQVAVDQSSEQARLINVKQIIDETLMSLMPRLKKLQHHVNIDCPEELNVVCKAGPIIQVLINLIMNSIIHAFEGIEKGQIDILVSLAEEEKLKIIYKDNGKGIPSTLKPRIFDPFVTTKRGQGGSGLGLHLVFNLVTQALGGTINIQSEEGNGVEFTLIFPVIKK